MDVDVSAENYFVLLAVQYSRSFGGEHGPVELLELLHVELVDKLPE